MGAYRLLALDPAELLGQCRQARYQGPGPGGQKRNRVYSGIRLTHPPSGLHAEASERREARRNLEDALHRLRMDMALSAGPGRDAQDPDGEIPDPAAAGLAFPQPRFRAGANPGHADFPRFALRALHWLAAKRGRLAETAAELDCTVSALARFLKADKGLWRKAQEIRTRNGLGPLK